MNNDLTKGSITGGLIRFAIPLFLGQLLQQFYNMADAWVVGNFASNDAFAAVSSGSQAADTEVPRLSGQEDCGVGRTLVWHYHRFRLVVQ